MSEAQTVEKADPWQEHCRDAVRKFVMNAVVIDNEPVLDSSPQRALLATSVDDGMDFDNSDTEGTIDADEPVLSGHELDVRTISDAFSDEEISCAFVFPKDDETDRDSIKRRVLAAAKTTDIVVIDWYLTDSDPTLTMQILQDIARADVSENGRMRLICVYTGQTDTADVTDQAVRALTEGGLGFNEVHRDKGSALGNHHCLLVCNKIAVSGNDLPRVLLNALAGLGDGLLPAFSLAAVAAVRRNVHHIVTRFSSDHDAAFVANRLITDPPGDVAELMRELFISECDTALGLEKVADNFLESNQICYWLAKRKQPIKEGLFEVDNVPHKIDRNFLGSLLDHGITGENVSINNVGEVTFSEEKREKISASLHGSKASSKISEGNLSRFVSLKREAFGNTKLLSGEGWTPSLTLGTLLRQQVSMDEDIYSYFYCLTPACDTIRLKGKARPFLMLELQESKGMTNLIVGEETGQKKLRIDPKPYNVKSFTFRGCDQTGRVQGRSIDFEKIGTTGFLFDSASGKDTPFLWLGEVRRSRANKDMADLSREWLRFGIKDLEYLRLAGRGKAKF